MPRILVVDDEPDGLELLTTWLHSHNYNVVTSDNGIAALELAEVHQPDLIILDVVMPGMDGIQTCRQLRRRADTQNIPVLLLTAHDPLAGRSAGLRAGADDYLAKPIDFDELQSRIQTLLGGSSTFVEQSRSLIAEVVSGIIPTLSSHLAWVLEVDTQQQMLATRTVATSRQPRMRFEFLDTIMATHAEGLYPLSETQHPLVRAILTGRSAYNMTLSTIRASGDQALYRAATQLDIYFLTLLPLQAGRSPVGLLVIGSLEPLDVDTQRGQQVIDALRNQAASALNNVRLTRLLAEREAESSRERAFRQTLLDTMGDGLLVHDGSGRIRFVNERLKRMTGYNQEQMFNLNVEDLFHPEERQRVADLVRVVNGHLPQTALESRLQQIHGDTLSVLVSQAARPVMKNEQGSEYVIVITDLSERRAREAALSRQTHHMTALSRASEMVTSAMESERIIELILEEAQRALNATNTALIMPALSHAELCIRAATGPHASTLKGVDLIGQGDVVAHVFASGHTVLGRSTEENDRTHEMDDLTGEKTQSYIAVPLVIQDDVGGVLTVTDERDHLFDRKDVDLLQSLASTASLAIENNNLYTEAQQRVRELTLLLQASEATSSAFAIEQVMEDIAYQLMDTIEADYCLISSWVQEESALMRLAETASIHASGAIVRRMHLNDHPLSEAVIRSASTTMFSTVNTDIPLEAYGTLMNNRLTTLTLVPIIVDGRVAGVIEMYDLAQRRMLNRNDLERIETIATSWVDALPTERTWHEADMLEDLCGKLRETSGLGWSTVLRVTSDDQLEVIFEAGKVIWSLGDGPFVNLSENSVFIAALRDLIPFSASMDDDTFTPQDRELLPTLVQGTMLVAPLMARGAAIGMVIVVDTSPKREFSMTELSLMQAIANVMGHALENAHLFAELSHRANQLEMAYNHLREADRIKDEVIQNVSHELRTPLTLIMGYAELLVDNDLGELNDAQREAVETINEKSIQLAKLVEDILTVRLMESENLRRSPALLSEVAEVAIRSMRARADRMGIKLVTYFDDYQAVNVNKSRMIQVFENLLSNAIKFSPSGSEITIRIQDQGGLVRVSVQDEGIGIPAEEHDKIWWRFYQVDGSTTRQFGGTGLGLAIVKRVIEQHDGQVWVESEPGHGSTFGFLLPTVDDSSEFITE